MKNTRYFPFERNRYFYGKLMTVRDFEAEQQYNNDKRRLVNRLFHGAGVVAGLQVVLIDEKTVSVEMGVALDYAGRELVVATPQTLKLSAVAGFPLQRIPQAVYLCIAYDELGKEPVFSPTKDRSATEQLTEYNRVAEQYRFFLIPSDEEERRSAFSFFEQTIKVVETEQWIIWLTAPKAVVYHETAAVTVQLEAKVPLTEGSVQLMMDGESFHLALEDGATATHWRRFGRQDQQLYETIVVEEASCNGQALRVLEEAKVQLVRGSLEQFYTELYREQPLSFLTASQEHLSLAKIDLLPAGTTYAIERVTVLPYEERITETQFFQQLARYRQQFRQAPIQMTTAVVTESDRFTLAANFVAEQNEWQLTLATPTPKPSVQIATGTIDIQWPEQEEKTLFRKGNDVWYSAELSHGLGEGDVFVDLMFGERNDMRPEQRRLYGEHAALWNGTEHEVVSEWRHSVIVFPHRGTFQVAVKNGRQNGTIHWRAMKEDERWHSS